MIAIGADHGGVNLKEIIKKFLEKKGIEYKDFGTNSTDSCDYPDYAKKVCDSIISGECERGILVCGTGIGMSIAANKIRGVRAALCADHFSAKYTRLHNDANIICMGARTLGSGVALELVDLFLHTPFEGGRHEKRVAMIKDLENNF